MSGGLRKRILRPRVNNEIEIVEYECDHDAVLGLSSGRDAKGVRRGAHDVAGDAFDRVWSGWLPWVLDCVGIKRTSTWRRGVAGRQAGVSVEK